MLLSIWYPDTSAPRYFGPTSVGPKCPNNFMLGPKCPPIAHAASPPSLPPLPFPLPLPFPPFPQRCSHFTATTCETLERYVRLLYS